MRKKLPINVLIPAYNEENNIQNIISDLLLQVNQTYVLKKIYVVSDGSVDNTVIKAKMFNNKKIIVLNNKQRKGKLKLINRFLEKYSGKTLVQLDADIRIVDPLVIEYLIRHIYKGADLVTGYHKQFRPKGLVQNMADFGIEVWEEAKNSLGKKGERYWVCGQIRAFSRRFVQNFRYPKKVSASEDTYSFYWVKTHGYKYVVEPRAVVYFKLPDNLKDYLKQMKRYLQIPKRMALLFEMSTLKKYETMRFWDKLKVLLKVSIRRPYYALVYFVIQGYAKIVALKYVEKPLWEVSRSTKTIN